VNLHPGLEDISQSALCHARLDKRLFRTGCEEDNSGLMSTTITSG